MTELEKALKHLTSKIKEFRSIGVNDGEALVSILQQITATLFYLEKERAEYHKKFQAIIGKEVSSGTSVSRAENLAHIEVPEMYLLRHIMSSAYEVVGAIRTQVSWLKTERINN
jgi:hypothetical protein